MCLNLPVNAGDPEDLGLIPGLEKSPGGGNGNPLQYSCLDNPMGTGACGLQSMRSQVNMHTHIIIYLGVSKYIDFMSSQEIMILYKGQSMDRCFFPHHKHPLWHYIHIFRQKLIYLQWELGCRCNTASNCTQGLHVSN